MKRMRRALHAAKLRKSLQIYCLFNLNASWLRFRRREANCKKIFTRQHRFSRNRLALKAWRRAWSEKNFNSKSRRGNFLLKIGHRITPA
jgi:hypothetical protein